MEFWHWIVVAVFLGVVAFFAVREERRLRRSREQLFLVDTLPDLLTLISERVAPQSVGSVRDMWTFSEALVEIEWLGTKLQGLHYPRLWRLGVLLACPVSVLRGEELDSLSKAEGREFRQRLARTLSDLARLLAIGNIECIDRVASEYCHLVITRGKPPQQNLELESLNSFVNSLEMTQKALNRGHFSEARRQMKWWYRSWRGSSHGETTMAVLPSELMAEAIIVAESVLSIYGDTLDWLDSKYVVRLSKSVETLVERVKTSMQSHEPGTIGPDLRVLEDLPLDKVVPTRVV